MHRAGSGPAGRSRTGFHRFGFGNVEVRVSHVIEEVREAAQHDAGDDLHDLAITVPSIANGSELLIADLTPTFQHVVGECQSGFGATIFGVAGATGEYVGGGQARRGSHGAQDRRAIIARVGFAGGELHLVVELAADLSLVHRRAEGEKGRIPVLPSACRHASIS